jgi:hypothetical protein
MSNERFSFRPKHNGRSWYAVLDENGNPVECDMHTWSQWFALTGQRIIKQDRVEGYFVSTVFIGCYHWFETMIFAPAPRGELGESLWRKNCDTKANALANHELVMRWIENDEIRESLEYLAKERTSPPEDLLPPGQGHDTRD